MARELYAPLGETGLTKLYARRLNAAGQYWRGDTSAYESFNAENIALYGADAGSGTPYNVMSEDGATGNYWGTDPTSGLGVYEVYEQAGAEPAEADELRSVGTIGVNVTHIEGTDATDAIEAAATAAIAAAGLTGAGGIYTQTVTVTSDGTTAIPNATVELWSGAVLVSTKKTSVLGVASPSCNAGSFTLKVLASGYNDYSAALNDVAGNTTVPTITLSAITSPASTEPDTVTVRWRVKKTDRTYCGAGDATVYLQIIKGPGTAGFIYHGDNLDFDSEETDANGYVNFTNVPVSCTVAVKTGTSRKVYLVEIPADATSPYDAGEIVSHDA